jgi:hypothetical protein
MSSAEAIANPTVSRRRRELASRQGREPDRAEANLRGALYGRSRPATFSQGAPAR